MAQFFAEIHGARGPASRLGHKNTGIHATVKSWEGEVNIVMTYADARGDGGRDYLRVTLEPHSGHNLEGDIAIVLYEGPCDGWRAWQDAGPLGRHALDREFQIKREAA